MSYTLYEVGSSCVPFIKNPHDVDLFIINATEQEKKDILDNYRKAYNCHYVSNHDSAELFQPVLYGLVPYYKCLKGDTTLIEDYTIEIVIKTLLINFEHLNQKSKGTYRALLACYRLEGKTKLTKQDKAWVQLAHDGHCPDEAYNYIKKVLEEKRKEYAIEF